MGTLASHTVVFRGVVLAFSIQTTAWEAMGTRDTVKEKNIWIRDTEGKNDRDKGYLKKQIWGYSTRSLGIRDCTIKGIWDISSNS